MHTYDVRIWAVRQRKDRGPTSAELRWKTGHTPHSQTFRTKTLADGRRAELLRAPHAGEPFDEATGVPVRELRQHNDVSWYQHARDYIEMKWPHSPGSTRRTLSEAMATIAPALVADTKGMADARTVRTALYSWAFNMTRRAEEPPPEGAKVLADLVALLRWHIVAYEVAPDGRLFRTQRGGLVQGTGYGEVWAEARLRALTPAQRSSSLAKRPYDLRHTAVSTWLSSGVEPQVVAQRAGHSVAVLFRVYAKCLDGAAATANARIEATLRGGRQPAERCPTPAPHKLVTTRYLTRQGETKAP
ncbi:hypothetical protein OG763_20450 [Streptomyces sp. NBC_01230]|uniref:hypothetical protein n=1 Tax=unclassified Streptomyces TaxID=2593676 RepID=UPI002E149737|nr:hypothetical protein OG763_20450 [Streptomyces sp. NBC_01230]